MIVDPSILNPVVLLPLVFMLLLSRPVRRDPPDKGRVCSPLLQPTELRLPAALRVPLEEPAPLLHDGDRGKNLLFPVFHGSCMLKPGESLKSEDKLFWI